MLAKSKFWLVVGSAGAIAATLVSFQALGMVMPWQAATASEVASKERVNGLAKRVENLEDVQSEVKERLSNIDGKLDILIQLQTK